MMKYRATTNENFYYLEAKKVANVLKNNKELSRTELFKYVKENDLLEANNERNLKKKFQTVYKRISVLNDFLINRLAEEAPDVGKFINLVSIVLNEKIVFDFMYEILQEKYVLMDKNINDHEFIKFFSEKSEQIEEVSKWTEVSKKKLIVKIKTYLSEARYLVKGKEQNWRITNPLIPGDITKNIRMEYGQEISKALLV